MNEKVNKNLVKFLGSTDEDPIIQQFTTLLNLPNEQFDLIYEDLKTRLEVVFSSKKFQAELISQLDMLPPEDISLVRNEIETFFEDVRADESLSEKKKDLIITLIDRAILEVYRFYDNPRERIKVKITKINPNAKLPEYAHDSDAGADIFAIEDVTLKPHTTQIIKTGIKVAIPKGYEIQIRPRSGLSLKTSLRIANCVGTIDCSYRGEVGVIMENTGNLSVTINKGDKIAQMIIAPVPMIEWEEVESLDETERGEQGYGSTDTK